VPRGGNLSDAAGVTSHPVDERSRCACSPPLDRCLGRSSRAGRGSTFPNNDQRLPGQLLRQDPRTWASTIAALQRASPRLFDAACASASRGRSLK
jgi:hypothetical protein